MTHQQRRCPAPIYQISANPSSFPLHPSHNKRTLLSPACDNVQKPVISLRGQRVVRQFVARPTTSNPSLPRSRKRTAWPGAVKQGVGPDDEEDCFMATVFLQFWYVIVRSYSRLRYMFLVLLVLSALIDLFYLLTMMQYHVRETDYDSK